MPDTTTEPVITLPPQVRASIDSSMLQGMPLVIAYRDADGHSRPSFRGSTHVHSPTQLAIWVRNPAGGLPRAVAGDPALTIVYRNPLDDIYYHLTGRGHLASDQPTKDQVYAQSPPMEQAQDPQRRGTALVIDIVRLAGHANGEAVLLES